MGTIKTHTKTIDGLAYTTRTLPATQGLVILPKIIALCGEALAGLFIATDDQARRELLQDPAVVGRVIGTIAERAADSDGLLVLRDLLASTECDKIQIGEAEVPGSVAEHFDSHFAGRYQHLVSVALWVAQCNFIAP